MRFKFQSILLLLFVAFVVSCSSYDLDMESGFAENELFGVWVDSVQTQSLLVNTMVFRPNLSFVVSNYSYGLYSGQSNSDVSAYTEFYGNYVLSAKNIYFASKQDVIWDSFTGKSPVLTVRDQVLFESCTYSILKDTLTLSYITYPADAPVVTVRKYIRTE